MVLWSAEIQLYSTTCAGVTSLDNYRWVERVVMSSTLCELEISFGLVFWVTLDFELWTRDIRRTPRGTLLWHNRLQCRTVMTFSQGHSTKGEVSRSCRNYFSDTFYFIGDHWYRLPGHQRELSQRGLRWSPSRKRFFGRHFVRFYVYVREGCRSKSSYRDSDSQTQPETTNICWMLVMKQSKPDLETGHCYRHRYSIACT